MELGCHAGESVVLGNPKRRLVIANHDDLAEGVGHELLQAKISLGLQPDEVEDWPGFRWASWYLLELDLIKCFEWVHIDDATLDLFVKLEKLLGCTQIINDSAEKLLFAGDVYHCVELRISALNEVNEETLEAIGLFLLRMGP